MTLLIALPGPDHALVAAHDAARGRLPAMPALEGLLARARRLPAAPDWRSGVLAALGVAPPVQPEALVASRSLASVQPGEGLCFAAPLHVVAGISRVHLPPGGWLGLAEDATEWLAAFNAEFGGPGLQLQQVPGGWLLVADCAAAARDAGPEVLVGEPLERVAATDQRERDLRRLGAEVEMWLNDHPLNRARASRGHPVINCLWFWGGTRAGMLPQVTAAPAAWLYAGAPDAWLAGLAAHCGQQARAAADWQSVPHDRSTVLVLPMPRAGRSANDWQLLDTGWFGPAAAAVRAGRLKALRLQIGSSAWQLPLRSPWRWLRRRRPWYQLVSS